MNIDDCPRFIHENDRQEKRKAIIEAANKLVELCRSTNDEKYGSFVEDVLYYVSCLDYIEMEE